MSDFGSRDVRAKIRCAILRGDTVGEIRWLVDALRPLTPDELGLLSVLQACVRHDHDMAGAPTNTLALPPSLPLPAVVEVATLRITQEARTNVMRHAAAQIGDISIACTGTSLTFTIRDDGIGMLPQRHTGVGLGLSCERAEQLSDSCVIELAPEDGTCVVRRPCQAEVTRRRDGDHAH